MVRDITDFTFTTDTGASLNFDFNNDGTTEFTFSEFDSSIESYFNPNNVNFVTVGTMATSNWDVMKSLNTGVVVGSGSNFAAEGDAYINPFWAGTSDMFPNGDSYIGTTFKIGNNKYYGWILVNSNNGTITVKSYAYNDVPNQSIKTGQTLGTTEASNIDFQLSIFPNPVQEIINIKTNEKIISKSVINANGQMILNDRSKNNQLNVQQLASGVYFLEITTENNKKNIQKFIKK